MLLLCHQTGCELNGRDCQGNSALHLAVENGHDSCVKALLYYSEQAHIKLDIDGLNQQGETALHLASRWGYRHIVNLLLQWEADSRIVSKDRQTAVDVAQNLKISQAILKYQEVEDKSNGWKETNVGSKLWAGIRRQLSLKRSPQS